MGRLELVRAAMPPDGTDLKPVFTDPAVARAGLVGEDTLVRWEAGSAEFEHTGPEGFVSGWSDWLEPWESYRYFFTDAYERGDEVVLLTRLEGVTEHGGVAMVQEAAVVIRFEGERVAEMRFVLQQDDVLSEDD